MEKNTKPRQSFRHAKISGLKSKFLALNTREPRSRESFLSSLNNSSGSFAMAVGMQWTKKLSSGLFQDEPHKQAVLQDMRNNSIPNSLQSSISGITLAPVHTSHHSKDFFPPADSLITLS